MMDFKTPDRDRYRNYTPGRRDHLATVPPPEETPAETKPLKNKRLRRQPKRTSRWPKATRIIGALLLLAFIAWLAHGYVTTKNQLEQAKNSPSGTSGSQTDQLVGKVGQLVDLPQGETPTIATVNNAAKLKNQAFFSDAKNGDKVLIYSKAGKAILYRPSTNKIIEYSTINLSGSAT